MSAMADPRRCFPSDPLTDDDSEAVVASAVNDLVLLRSPMWSGDAGAVLHALASLSAEVDAWLPDAVADAFSRGYPWSEIARFIGVKPATARRRFAGHIRTWRPMTDPD
ncbi:MAG: hypothetical protein M3256_21250 [Actinomycetota bacterium]|nr:hypothetical protein [Actinomycetota bacterium]